MIVIEDLRHFLKLGDLTQIDLTQKLAAAIGKKWLKGDFKVIINDEIPGGAGYRIK